MLLVGLISLPAFVSAEVNGTITAGTRDTAGYFYVAGEIGSGNILLHNNVSITGIAYDWQGLTLRSGVGQWITDGFPNPLRLVLTQKSAPSRDSRFGRRIEFSDTDIDTDGRFAYIRHTDLTAEQSKDLRLMGGDILAGDVFWIYVYGQQVVDRPLNANDPRDLRSEQPPPDRLLTVHDIEFTLGWNPVANHKYIWETRDYHDTASPDTLYSENGRDVEINRIACDTPELRFISYEDNLRDVLPHTYALKIRKVWHTTGGYRHLRVLTDSTAVRVERFGDGSVLIVPKTIGSLTPEPNSPIRATYLHTIGGICANTVGINGSAYIHLVVTETVARAPRSPYIRKLTGVWGELKKAK